MTDLQKYQKYKMKQESSGSRVFKFILWLVLIVVLIWVFKGCLGGQKEEKTETPANENVNEAINANLQTEENNNVNSSVSQSAVFDLKNCPSVFSRGRNRKEVALTFNAASRVSNLTEIIDILKTNKVPADFFVAGKVASENQNEISNLASQGFGVYNLSYSYPHVADLSAQDLAEELSQAEEAIRSAANVSSKPFFRPPYGETGGEVFETARAEGYCPVTWTVDAFDWSTDQTPSGAKERVMENLKEGTIVVMQVGTSLVPRFLQDLINEVKSQGYKFVDLATILTP